MPALLVGAPTRDLVGVDADLDGMSALVQRMGLGPARLLPRATLSEIRRELEALAEGTKANDPILIYLTGHGGVITNTAHGLHNPRPLPQRLHYFVTMPDEADGDAVLSDPELSLWCARLAARTANVAVIVDTCHASGLVREGREADELLAAFQTWRGRHQDELDTLDVEAHPSVVRLSAAGVHGVARPDHNGSALTRALLASLREEGAANASWLALFSRIEHHLALDGAAQQPRLSGPVRRRIFDLAEAMPPGAIALQGDGQRWMLVGGTHQGIAPGDLFSISSATGEHLVEVDSVSSDRSTLASHGPPPEPSVARFAVPLYLRRVTGERATRYTCGPTSGARAFTATERLQALGGASLGALGLRSSWGRVRGGLCEPLTSPTAELADTDLLYVRLENTTLDRRFVSVFWVSEDGDIALLSRSESMGIELAGRTCHLLGDRSFSRAPRGIMPPRRPFAPGEHRSERLLIVASPHRQSLWSFDLRGGAPPSRNASLTSTETFHFTVRNRHEGRAP